MPKVLAVESCTTWASTALVENNKILAEESSGSQKTHSEFLNHSVDSILRKCNFRLDEIDIFAVGIGPGSFTGIRVALNIAKTFSYIYKKPIYACDSLSLLQQQTDKNCLTMINAFKNMVYWRVFQEGHEPTPAMATPALELEKNLSRFSLHFPLVAVGDGYNAYESVFSTKLKQQLMRKSSASDYPKASTLGILAETKDSAGKILQWNTVLPLYIRASEAEENLKRNP